MDKVNEENRLWEKQDPLSWSIWGVESWLKQSLSNRPTDYLRVPTGVKMHPAYQLLEQIGTQNAQIKESFGRGDPF